MSIEHVLFFSIISGILSSLCTLAILTLYLRSNLKRKIKQETKEAGELIKERIHSAVMKAGEELLPKFRKEVNKGFTDAFTRALSGEIIPQTARQLAKNSQNIVEQGLSFLLGRAAESSPEQERDDKK